jgi:hypothetical protein
MTECASSSDCVNTHYCGPERRQCVPKSANGTACENGSECSTGHCVDGVCCDEACDGSCEVCSFGERDKHAGRCRRDVEGVPRGGRQPCVGTGQCVGYCVKGSRECFYPGAARECAPPSCVSGLLTPARQCDGTGSCAAQPAQACPGFFACSEEPPACKTSCVSDSDCANGARCAPETGSCVLPGGTCRNDFSVKLPDGVVRTCHGYRCIGDGQCAESCSAELGCAPGYACVNGRCKESPTGGEPDAGAHADGGQDDGASSDPDCACRVVGVRSRTSYTGSTLAVAGLMFGIGLTLRARSRRRRHNAGAAST